MMVTPSPACATEPTIYLDGSTEPKVYEFANGPDEPPKCRIYCPRCSKRFYTRATRGQVAVCYHCKAEVRSTGARSQDPAGWRGAHRAGARP